MGVLGLLGWGGEAGLGVLLGKTGWFWGWGAFRRDWGGLGLGSL